MKIKQLYLVAVERRRMDAILRYAWRNLKTEPDGTVFAEFDTTTTKEALLRNFRPGIIIVACGVRLRLDYVYVQERAMVWPTVMTRIWRVRMVFVRLDYTMHAAEQFLL